MYIHIDIYAHMTQGIYTLYGNTFTCKTGGDFGVRDERLQREAATHIYIDYYLYKCRYINRHICIYAARYYVYK